MLILIASIACGTTRKTVINPSIEISPKDNNEEWEQGDTITVSFDLCNYGKTLVTLPMNAQLFSLNEHRKHGFIHIGRDVLFIGIDDTDSTLTLEPNQCAHLAKNFVGAYEDYPYQKAEFQLWYRVTAQDDASETYYSVISQEYLNIEIQ